MKKKLMNTGLVLLFSFSLLLLGMQIFGGGGRQTVAGVATETGLYTPRDVLDLGKVEVHNFQRMGFTKGFVRFSPDSRYLAAGTEDGDILLTTADGQLLWRRNIGLGKLAALEFSADGSRLLAGETSQQGGLLCLDVKDGRELWRHSSVDELGVDIKRKTYPGIVAIRSGGNGEVYAVGLRYIRHADGNSEYRGRVYKYSLTGERLALFPADHNIDTWVNWLGVDKQAARVVFGTANWSEGVSRYDATMYCLDGELRQILWQEKLPAVVPYQNPTMRNGPDITADGRYVSGVVSDGRGFVYDGGSGRRLWLRTLSRPQQIGGVFVNAVGLYGQTAGSHFLFSTGNTYNRANWQLPTPFEHPSANSLFIFDREGTLTGRVSLRGMLEQLSANDNAVAVAVGRNVRAKDTAVHGLTLLAIPDGRMLDRLPTEGPCVAAAISADGNYAAAVEAPLQLDDGRIIGGYKLWLLQKEQAK
ncbi:MAG: PQQ-binding-like beta-propeller repeat protein [Sporomusaceae bacterium]|nr:PQQ-binding-like beta-propeller repeat protein [Sporomusaceae bacterium]